MFGAAGGFSVETRSAAYYVKYGLTSLEALKIRLNLLEENVERFLNHAGMAFRDILTQDGWSEVDATEWSTICLPYRIERDTVNLYISLHQQLYSVALVDGWATAKTELDLHASKLANRRSGAPSRLVAMCEVYCYLRDAKKSSWRTMQLMESRERALSRKVEESLKTSGGGNKVTLCTNRCHTCTCTPEGVNNAPSRICRMSRPQRQWHGSC
eukprot:scaffold109612_cov51-Attheya_sp.AAC.2